MSDEAEIIVEETGYISPHDDITAAYNAYNMLDGIDTKLLSKSTEKKIRDTQKMCINIVYESIKYINEMWVEDAKDDDE
jgi:hypothetical protein